MKKNLIYGIGGFVIGTLLLMVVIWNAAPGLMVLENQSQYSFEETLEKYKESVLKKGWKIPVTHNLSNSIKNYGKDVKKVQVVELCHPEYAYRILSQNHERIVASMMPCRVAFYEKSDGKVYISRMNTSLMGKMMSGVIPEVMQIASRESEEMLSSVIKP